MGKFQTELVHRRIRTDMSSQLRNMSDSFANNVHGHNPQDMQDNEHMNRINRSGQPNEKAKVPRDSTSPNNEEKIKNVEEDRKAVEINSFGIPPKPESESGNTRKVSELLSDDHDESKTKEQRKVSQYISFFKYYYEKLKAEHPGWSCSQITTIASLQWRKRKMITKSSAQSVSGSSVKRFTKPISAKDAFKRQNSDKVKAEIDELWNKLPKQSKNYWKKVGDSYGKPQSETSSNRPIQTVRNNNPLSNIMNMKMFLSKA